MGARRALLHGNTGESCQMSAISMVAPTRVQAEIREPNPGPSIFTDRTRPAVATRSASPDLTI